jgi:hypothetical protein
MEAPGRREGDLGHTSHGATTHYYGLRILV